MESYYQYDGSGQRTRKVVHKPGGIVEERLYFGSYELYREYQGNSQTGAFAEPQTTPLRRTGGRIRYQISIHSQRAANFFNRSIQK